MMMNFGFCNTLMASHGLLVIANYMRQFLCLAGLRICRVINKGLHPICHPITTPIQVTSTITLSLTYPLVRRSADCLTVERAVKGLNVSFPTSVTGKLVLRPVGKTMQEFLTLLITRTNDSLHHLNHFHLRLSSQFGNGN